MNKKDILRLMDNYKLDLLEKLLIKVYLNRKKIYNTTNELVKQKISNLDKEDIDYVDNYLKRINGVFDLKVLERIFELLIEEKDRKLNGAFYTPLNIVEYMCEKSIDKLGYVCDCSCGSGAFLVGAIERLKSLSNKNIIEIIEKYIYGVDISKRSIERSKIILALLAIDNGEDKKEINFNLVCNDSLKLDWNKTFNKVIKEKDGFDFVIGNPPYVRIQNLDDKTKEFIKENWKTARKYNVDLYIPFIELSLDIINKKGKVCLITSKSYLTSEAGKFIREILIENKYIYRLLDFNFYQLFEDVITYTSILFLNKKDKSSFEYHKIKNELELVNLDRIKFKKVNYSNISKDKIHINGYGKNGKIKRLLNQKNKIKDNYYIRIGIATLRDNLYLVTKKDNKFLTNYDGKNYEIETKVVKKILFANNIKSKNPKKNLYGWVIFPYKLKDDKYEVIQEKELKNNFPNCYRYFLDIKGELDKRDKGRERINNYGEWYAYGRVQGYNAIGNKLVCPNMMPEPRFERIEDDSLFVAGYALVCNQDIDWLEKILNSRLFWFYVLNQGKKIRNEFYVIGKKLLGEFSYPDFSNEDKRFLISENQEKVNKFLERKYKVII